MPKVSDYVVHFVAKQGVKHVLLVTGGTNAITGLVGAWLDSTPTVLISGQVKPPDRMFDAEGNPLGMRQLGVQEVQALNAAERPLFAGNGNRLARAEKEFTELVELLGIPVVARSGSVAARGALRAREEVLRQHDC